MQKSKSSILHKIYQSVVYGLVRFFIKPKFIAEEHAQALVHDKESLLFYVIPYRSIIDRMVLKSVCRQLNLKDPDQCIVIDQIEYLNTFALERAPNLPLTSHQFATLAEQFRALKSNASPEKVIFLPINIMFGKAPPRSNKVKRSNSFSAACKKIYQLFFVGRRCFTLFSPAIALNDVLALDVSEKGDDMIFFRTAKLRFAKQYAVFIGPTVQDRKVYLNTLLDKPIMQKLINDEADATQRLPLEVREEAMMLLEEIVANYKYNMLKLTDIVLTFAWNKLYHGLYVSHADAVRQVAIDGQEIIFAPCHRSHMDYLLLSYVLYRQGLVPPHIAAGVNLNFWPAGPIFRRLGAFFIRRTFRGNKLYTVTFREYLVELFQRGHSVEYFIEGGRSRTGRLLDPKTGMLLMTVQTLLRKKAKPITIVPVYIGYEHVMEVKTYEAELNGATKKHENGWQMVKGLLKLKNLGFGYVNFGEPISIHSFLNQHVPEWQNDRELVENTRPKWLMPTVNQLSDEIMNRINSAAAINAMNLCSLILLNSRERLTKESLLTELALHIDMIVQVPYSENITRPALSTEELLDHALEMEKVIIEEEGGIEFVTVDNRIYESYYRNNIQHLYILPSLITRLIQQQPKITKEELFSQVKTFYPLLKGEFFLYFDESQLERYIESYLTYLAQHHNVTLDTEESHAIPSALKRLSQHSIESLNRYIMLLKLAHTHTDLGRKALEKLWREETLAFVKKAQLPGLEYRDKTFYTQILNAVNREHYLEDAEKREALIALLEICLQDVNLEDSEWINR